MGNLNLLQLEETGISYGIEGMKILFYGGNTRGKTPQAMRFPKPLLLMGEAGGSGIKGHKVPITSKKDFVDVVKQLTDQKTFNDMKEKFQTIILDCAEDIVDVYKTSVAREYGCREVGEVQQAQKGNPNGYALYRTSFKADINKLCSYGYTVIFISHEEEIELDNGKTYLQPKGTSNVKDSMRFIKDLCDFRFYIKANGIDKESGKTIMSTAYCTETDKFYAGSRFDIVPIVNPFNAENIIEAITEAQKKSAENYGADLVSFEITDDGYTKQDYLESIEPYVSKLFELYPDEVIGIIEAQLGEGVKVSDAKDSQLVELETIYTNLVSMARDRNIEV